jgi:hypothetical protein
MIPDCTLTTACFNLEKYNTHDIKCRTKIDTINSIKSLLDVPCYLIIYTDETLYKSIREYRHHLDDITHYVVIDIESLDSFKYIDIVRENRKKYYPTKDERTCEGRHLICSSKFELVLKSIHLNPFNTSRFGWIDSNVGVNFKKICIDYKNNMLLKVLNECKEDKFYLQILNVCDPNLLLDLKQFYSQYRWIVCGCLFITPVNKGIKILTVLNDIFIKHTMAGYGHLEEMYYLEMLDKYRDDLHISYGDYHHMLNNFINPTVDLYYVYHITCRYLHFKQYHNCIHACETVIYQFENYNIEMNYIQYFEFLFNDCMANYCINSNKINDIQLKIKQLIDTNTDVKQKYLSNKSWYDTYL